MSDCAVVLKFLERGKEKTPSRKVDLTMLSRWKGRPNPAFDYAIFSHSNNMNNNSEFGYYENGATLMKCDLSLLEI